MKKMLPTLALSLMLAFATTGCGSAPDLPFQYNYTSPDSVEVTMNGTTYQLAKNTPPPAGLPFQYSFEDDGDLDITVAGTTYEIESPYDIDVDGKKKTKKKSTAAPKKSSGKKK
ncbi:MAG: hypothetical protein ACOY3Z_10335 [Thermodesulfobacteriota bacterium]